MTVAIEKNTLGFLKKLADNNTREWFLANKSSYQLAQQNVAHWLEHLITLMNRHDELQTQSGKEALYRIYNDVRFSADKTPYNPRFAGNLQRVKPYLRGGYYFWIKPGESRIGCGFTYPNAQDLLRIRQDIDQNQSAWRKLLRQKKLQSVFGNMQGDRVKTSPKGFPKDHPAIELLRYKQFWFEKSLSDKEVLAPDSAASVNSAFKSIRPFFDYLSEVLTTDLNGKPTM
jgi:uncharacterized protein (TIGR02453 family)